MLVPLAPAAPQAHPGAPPAFHAHPQQPQYPNVIPFRKAPKTNYLVKESAYDPYAMVLYGVPELPVQSPPGIQNYDAMEGRISPESMEALGPLLSEFPSARTTMFDGAIEVPRTNVNARPTLTIKGEGG